MHTFHGGVRLAKSSFFENAVFERVVATPVDLVAGRIWYNTALNTFNFTDIDGGGAIRVNTFASLEALQAGLDAISSGLTAEVARATAAEANEVAARIAAVISVQNALADEVAARTAGDSDEVAARQAGDAAVSAAFQAADAVVAQNAADALAAEAASRVQDDALLNTRIDGVVAETNVIETSVGLNTDGTFTAPENTVYLGAVETVKAGLVALDTAIVDVVTAHNADVLTVNAAIAAETTRATNAENNLQTQLTEWVTTQLAANENSDAAEVAARIAGDAALQTEVNTIETAVGLTTDGEYIVPVGSNYLDSSISLANADLLLDGQVKVLADAVVAETAARTTADASFQSQLTSEINNRTTAITNLQNELNTSQAGAGLQTDGTYVAATGANYIASATTLADADVKLDAAIKAVDDRATALESTVVPEVQASVTAEVARATAAENELRTLITSSSGDSSAAVDAEVARASAAEEALQVALNAEIARAQGIEGGLQSQVTGVSDAVTAEVARATNVENDLQAQITDLAAAAGEGASALKTELNARRYSYASTEAKTTHLVTTNLGTLDFSVDLKVKGLDNVWRNDVAPIEFAEDGNSFTVFLDEALNIRVSGQDNSVLV